MEITSLISFFFSLDKTRLKINKIIIIKTDTVVVRTSLNMKLQFFILNEYISDDGGKKKRKGEHFVKQEI